MKAYLAALVHERRSDAQGRGLVREYLQARILEGLQREGAMRPIAFHGGTALRFLYQLPRLSEDLDFALERPEAGYDFRAWLRAIQSMFRAEGYAVAIKVDDRRTVHSAFVRFPGLLHALGLSPHAGEVIAVKIEVDTRPPAGAGLATSIVRRHVLLHLQHHDRASLMAGKLHAVLQRPFVKGRDVYDLFWYLTAAQWPEPNLVLLNHALEQTGWAGPAATPDNWPEQVLARLRSANWAAIAADVRPFAEHPQEVDVLTFENLERVLGSRRSQGERGANGDPEAGWRIQGL